MITGDAGRVWAVIPAAGRGSRFDASARTAKQYAPLAGATVLDWALDAILHEPRVAGIALVLAADDAQGRLVAARHPDAITCAVGGADRQHSVLNGLTALASRAADQDWVLVHDAARPCLTSADLTALLDAVTSDLAAGGAILAAPIVDTVKRGFDGTIRETVDRAGLWRALTPQVFRYGALRRGLEAAAESGSMATDEAQAMERLGIHARLVPGSPFNIKVTLPEDLSMAETLLSTLRPASMRVGQGFDVHAFGDGDHVVLGGVKIAHARGVIAHSDGDVVIHALCDALLGALSLGDIGQHFPDTDARFKGADSRVFLREVAAKMHAAGYGLVNADVTVLAEAPRVARHRAAMTLNLGADLHVDARVINIKATTTERLGFVGRGEGLAASAAVLLASQARSRT